jgi:O-antigen/teichoic acid export membrane protein
VPRLTSTCRVASTDQRDNPRRASLARGAMSVLFLQVSGSGLGYVSQVVLARWMGVSQFGTYAYTLSWAALVALLATLGLPSAALRLVPEYLANDDPATARAVIRRSRQLVGSASLAIILLGALAVRVTGLSPLGGPAVALLGLTLVPSLALSSVDSAIARGLGRFATAYAPWFLVRPILFVAACAGLLRLQGTLSAQQALALAVLSYALAASLQSYLSTHRAFATSPAIASVRLTRRWLGIALPLLLVTGFQVALGLTDVLAIGAIRGARDAGVYAAAAKTAALVTYPFAAVDAVMTPRFAGLFASRRFDPQRLAAISVHWGFWPCAIVSASLWLGAPLVLRLFGPSFDSGTWPLRILVCAQLFSAACGSSTYLLTLTGHQRHVARIYAATAGVNACTCAIGATVFGMTGAAAATAISIVIWNVMLHRSTSRRLGIAASILHAQRTMSARRAFSRSERANLQAEWVHHSGE